MGCLFSKSLCNQENEWCFNDVAFGKCLPRNGDINEDDLHRFNFAATDMHILEGEMQRLYLLGYRWSHTYTQCVLQAVLEAIRKKSEFDISTCNAELDQDLEGALNAIEGEEMEHIDPRNLAIVRFTPSMADPHSDFADEIYYPPLDEMIPPPALAAAGFSSPGLGDSQNRATDDIQQGIPPNERKQLDQLENGKDHSNGMDLPVSIPSRESDLKFPFHDTDLNLEDEYPILPPHDLPFVEEDEDAPRLTPQDIINERLSLPPPALQMSLYLDHNDKGISPYDVSSKNYDYDLLFQSPYSTIPRVSPMYKRNERSGNNYDNGKKGIEGLIDNLLRRSPSDRSYWRDLAYLLSGIRHDESAKLPPAQSPYSVPPRFFPAPGIESERNLNGRRIINSDVNYYEEPNPFGNPRQLNRNPGEQIPYYSSYGRDYNPSPGIPGLASELPVLPLPVENDNAFSPDETLNPPYVKSDYDSPKETKPYEFSLSRYDTEADPIFEPMDRSTEDSNQYDWSVPDQASNQNSYSAFADSDDNYIYPYGYPRENESPAIPTDSYYGRPLIYPPHPFSTYDYKDINDYRDYVDYPTNFDYAPDYGNGGGVASQWNLHRDERLDVKKPGPRFKSQNDFAFDQVDDELPHSDFISENPQWLNKLNGVGEEAILLTKLRQGHEGNGIKPVGETEMRELQMEQFPDLLLTDERFVPERINDKGRGQPGNPKTAYLTSPKNIADGQDSHQKEKDTYIYISNNKNFPSEKLAEQMVGIILRHIGLKPSQIQNLSVDQNQVMFQLKEGVQGVTPALVAERAEELRDVIKKKTDMEITQAGVGTKSAISAMVYSSGRQQMLAVAAIVCGVCAALLVAATTLFFLRRHSRSKAKLQGITAHDTEASKDYQDLCRERMAGKGEGKDPLATGPGHAQPVGSASSGHAPGHRISSLSKESDNGNNSPSSRSSTSSWSEEPVMSNMDISTGHMVLSYMEDHLRNKDRLEQEWVALCAYEAEPCNCNIALKPENAQKNRYLDALPYDHNRVILNEHANVSGSNYINASSITDHDPRNPAYIGTQGPLAATAADLWQLVWEQGSVVIVMLTRLTENGQAMCHRYWPEEGSELYHIYEVHLVSEHIWCDDYLVRSFFLKNVKTGETRTVTQFHFLSWPEYSIPASTKALLEFRRKVNKSYRGRACPIIVHCSDGVGRTGTYCLIDMVLNRMSKGAKEIDIAATLEHIRDQRPNMVKTKAQFEFVLMSVAEEVHAILKALVQ